MPAQPLGSNLSIPAARPIPARHLFSFARAAVLLAVSAAQVLAGTTYNYTGNPFKQFIGATGETPSNFITASITLANPIPASFSGLFTLDSWQISDGIHTTTSADAGVIYLLASFTTNAGSLITAWHFVAQTNSVGLETTSSLAFYNDGINGSVPFYDMYANRSVAGVDASNNTAHGSWSSGQTSSAPEPDTWLLVLTDGLLFLARRARIANAVAPACQVVSGNPS